MAWRTESCWHRLKCSLRGFRQSICLDTPAVSCHYTKSLFLHTLIMQYRHLNHLKELTNLWRSLRRGFARALKIQQKSPHITIAGRPKSLDEEKRLLAHRPPLNNQLAWKYFECMIFNGRWCVINKSILRLSRELWRMREARHLRHRE